MNISLADIQDIDEWMKLVEYVKDSFPGLDTKEALEEHQRTVVSFMEKKAAICAKNDNEIVGTLLFSKDQHRICFLAVNTKYRRLHIAEDMLAYMISFMNDHKDIIVTTFCEGQPEGIAARAFYKRMGFVEGELCEEFGVAVQTLILKR